jgi:hypothetical protein
MGPAPARLLSSPARRPAAAFLPSPGHPPARHSPALQQQRAAPWLGTHAELAAPATPLPAGSNNTTPIDWADFCLLLEDRVHGFPYLGALPKLGDFAGRGPEFGQR